MGPARKRVLRKSVVTVFAICVSFVLWGNNRDQQIRHSFESSLNQRHLLAEEEDDSSLETTTSQNSSGKSSDSIAVLETPNTSESGNSPEKSIKLTEQENRQKPIKSSDTEESVAEELPRKEVSKEDSKNNEEISDDGVPNLERQATEQPKSEISGEAAEVSLGKALEEDIRQGQSEQEKDVAMIPVTKPHQESKSEEGSVITPINNEKVTTNHKGQGTKKHQDGGVGKGLVQHKQQPETVAKDREGQLVDSATTSRPPSLWAKMGKEQGPHRPIPPATKASNESRPTAVPIEGCTEPAYHEFPPDLFTEYQRAHGAVIIHILVIIYMFYAVAVVCDDYFVASLEECCARLNLSEDVAGATFMAAGSSAPELFTAILGVLVAKGDVGTGTIVGSAVFNVLFVIGICGIFSGRIVELTWWPLFRDSIFYSCTVIMLIAIIFDSEVTWYESLIMMLTYVLYIILMKFNNDVHFWVSRRLGIEDDSTQNVGILAQGDKKNYSSYVPFNNEIDECASMPVTARFSLRAPPADESIRSNGPSITSIYEASLVMMIRRDFGPIRPVTRFRIATCMIIVEQRRLKKEASKLQGQISIESTQEAPKFKSIGSSMGLTAESNWKSWPTREEGPKRLIKWLIQAPLLAVLYYTIPDCRQEQKKKLFMLTFLCSITWTAIFSYVMVWMVTLVGYTLGIPDSIMGITFLAAGTSVPDAFASLIVARQGQGDMAVSNSLGSNIFDILIGLAFPWFIQTTMVEPGSIATINSRGMVYSVILLFLTIVITIGGIFFSRWQLTRRLGIVLLCIYVLFLIISVLLEFNFLGYVNPPMCQD